MNRSSERMGLPRTSRRREGSRESVTGLVARETARATAKHDHGQVTSEEVVVAHAASTGRSQSPFASALRGNGYRARALGRLRETRRGVGRATIRLVVVSAVTDPQDRMARLGGLG